MKPMLVVIMLVTLPLIAVSPRAAADGADKVDTDIRAMLDLTGAFKVSEQVMKGMIAPLAQAHPQIPASFWTEMMKRVNKQDFYDIIVPIYRNHLSPSDIKALLTFYRTAAGKHLIEALPMITQESLAAGQTWGVKIVQDMLREAKQRGYQI